MVTTVLRTIFNETVGYHFCQVSVSGDPIVLATTKSVSIYEIYKSRSNYEYFYQKLSRPQETWQTTLSRLKTTDVVFAC